jgi:hypothetical protein
MVVGAIMRAWPETGAGGAAREGMLGRGLYRRAAAAVNARRRRRLDVHGLNMIAFTL